MQTTNACLLRSRFGFFNISAFEQTVVLMFVLISEGDFSVKSIWCKKEHILAPPDVDSRTAEPAGSGNVMTLGLVTK